MQALPMLLMAAVTLLLATPGQALVEEYNCNDQACTVQQGKLAPCLNSTKLPDHYCTGPLQQGSLLIVCTTPPNMLRIAYTGPNCNGEPINNSTVDIVCVNPDKRILCSPSPANKPEAASFFILTGSLLLPVFLLSF